MSMNAAHVGWSQLMIDGYNEANVQHECVECENPVFGLGNYQLCDDCENQYKEEST